MEAIIVDYQEQLDRRQQLLSLNQEANLEHTCPDAPDSEPVLQEPVLQQAIVVTSLPRGWFTEDLSSERLFQPLTLSEPDPETNNRSGRQVCSIFTPIERCNETP